MIEAKNLIKTYHMGSIKLDALKNVSLNIKKGEFVFIMGPSGSGKSTLLHQLALLDEPTSGKIIIEEIDTATLSDMQKTKFRLNKLGYVFQEYAILKELTALENVYLPAMTAGADKSQYIKRGLKLLETVGLKNRSNHLPSELSGGQQQRVAIARALVNKPKLLFADEPCANLDTESSKSILELFVKLNKESDQTIVMVTHEEWHKKYAQRIIYLKDGIIESP
ncbi:MAG: ABC transporter ATP-binding protein [Candidatus Aenigmarchaeota archaeon]|nr:ABC transporter ATP-binding protein [Candidatus Aenigmarchaeota archaeon]